MGNNVLLINPSYNPSYAGTKASIVNPVNPTLGLATIAATADERGHKVEILDMSWRPYDFQQLRNLINNLEFPSKARWPLDNTAPFLKGPGLRF